MKYKPGDLVSCRFSEEVIQPMEIAGRNLWFSDILVYYVKGKHKRGNEVTICLTENCLTAHSSNG